MICGTVMPAGQRFHPLQLGTQRRLAVIAVAMDAQGDPLAVLAPCREHRVLAVFHQFDIGKLAVPMLQGVAGEVVQSGRLAGRGSGCGNQSWRGLR